MNETLKELEYKLNRFLFKFDVLKRRRLWMKLSKLISNGVPIIDALNSILARRIDAGDKTGSLTIAIKEWIERLNSGERISYAIKGWVTHEEQMLIAAGEQSGHITEAMLSASDVMVAKQKVKSAVIGGMLYPVAMFALATFVLVMFSYKIIPSFSRIAGAKEWHGPAHYMIIMANFTREWIPYMAALVVVILVAFFVSLPRWSNGFRIKLDKYPPYSVYRMMHGSTWMISFAALVSAGVRVESALQQLSDGASVWMLDRIGACLRLMRSGHNTGDALAKTGYGFPDLEIIDDLAVYSRLSGFDTALSIIGREWMTQSVEEIQSMMKVISGFSLLLVGGFVVFMVSGLISMELQLSTIIHH